MYNTIDVNGDFRNAAGLKAWYGFKNSQHAYYVVDLSRIFVCFCSKSLAKSACNGKNGYGLYESLIAII